MSYSNSSRRRVSKRSILVSILVTAFALSVCRGQGPRAEESARLAQLLGWHAGSVVAEIGAGAGQMSLAAAQRVGPQGHVYTNEIDPRKLADLKELAAKAPEHNLSAVKGSQSSADLPANCCDSIFMRHVYHHFTEPARLDASLLRSLKPGGLLAVIDFPPRSWLSPVPGVPKNRGGHGIPEKVLIQELTAAGFKVQAVLKDWPGDDYCVVFRKPAP